MKSKIRSRIPLVVIVGPTASGKTDLAIKIAKQFNGELISADSRAVYRGLDIGSAKPTESELGGVKIWGVDLADPDQTYSVHQFKLYADKAIDDIKKRGKLPILVGGSGLYVDAVLHDYKFYEEDANLRQILSEMTLNELNEYCNNNNIDVSNYPKNKRHIISKIIGGNRDNRSSQSPIGGSVVVGITTEKEILRSRILERANNMLQKGVRGEHDRLVKRYGNLQTLKGNIYQALSEYGSDSDVVNRSVQLDMRLVKKQLTWFKRHSYIKWLSLDEASKYLIRMLSI